MFDNSFLPITDIAVAFVVLVALGMVCASIADRLRLQRLAKKTQPVTGQTQLTAQQIDEILESTENTAEETTHGQ
jgi:uncharacterized protein YoxC